MFKGDIMQEIFRIDDPYAFLTRELLEREYVTNKLTDQQIAIKYNIGSKVTIWRRRRFYGITNSHQNKSNQHATKNRKFIVSREDALKWMDEGKTYDDMAKLVGCSRMVFYRRIKELGIVEECPEAMKKLRWHEKLTDTQIKFLLGDLLGDGNITSWGMYQCSHSYKQKSYIEHKCDILSNLISPNFNFKENLIKNHQNGKEYRSYYLRSMGNEKLKDIYKIFYKGGVKIFPYEYLMQSNFDAYGLAIWYMDDGSRNKNTCSLQTQSFDYAENTRVLDFLNTRFSICGVLQEINSRAREIPEKHKWYVRFNKMAALKFFQLVAPHILPYFQYKLPIEFRQNPV